ncbi:hypothetical protein F7725_010165 [Dissostichus mawsoni]|uniref:Uncharacterized protein n=1 Tax=Dissostichus mawsoni TaxID=36200 RepID=A0A7J5XP95_DISMA|nr:hypothetical protein F7725_010165 [Dissostichus mawsoni]
MARVGVHSYHLSNQVAFRSFNWHPVLSNEPGGRERGLSVIFHCHNKVLFHAVRLRNVPLCPDLSAVETNSEKSRISGFDYMIGQPGVLSGVRVHRDHFGHQRASVCSFGDQLGHKGVALRGGVQLRNVPLCPDLSAVETNSEKSRISGFDYTIGQPGVLSGVRVHRDHFGHQRASVCSFGDQLGHKGVALRGGVQLRNVPLCPDLSTVETNSEKSRISGFDYMIGQPGVLSGVRIHRDHFGHQRASVCSFGDQLGHEGVALRGGVLFHAVRLRNVPLCPDLSAVETNSEKSRISGFDYMIGQPGVLSGVRVHRDHFGHQRASVCSFRDQLGHEGVALRGGVQERGLSFIFHCHNKVLFHAVRLRNVPLCPDLSAVETNSEKSRISGFDYMIRQPGVLSGVRVHRDHFGHQRASVCSFGDQLGHEGVALRGGVLFHAVRLRNVPLCPDLSAVETNSEKSRISGFDYMIRQPGVLSGVRVHRDHFGHQRASVCSFGDQLGHEGVALRGGVLFHAVRLRNVPLCPDLSAVETNSEKARISGFYNMIRQPGVLSGVRVHRDHFGHQRASVCSFGDQLGHEGVSFRGGVAEREGCPLSFTDTIRFCFMLSDSEMSLCPDLSAVETNSEKSRISGFDNMIRQPGVLSGVCVHRDHFGHQRASVCSFGDQLGHEGVALREGLRNVPLCPDLSAVETNSEKSRISGFDYMIKQPGVLSGVRVYRDDFGHQRASVCSFGDQLGHEGVALRGGVLFHAVRLRNVPLCSDLSAVETNSEKSRISGFDYMIGQPGVLSGVRVHRDHFGHQRASVCSFGDQLGHEGVALRGGVLFHAVRLRNVPLCPDLSAVETNSEKSRISGFDNMIRQPGVLSGVRVHRDHFGHQRASVCSFGDQLGHKELPSGEGLRNVPLCPDLSAVETNSEKSRITGFDYMIGQPGVLSGVRVHHDHFGHQRASVCSFGDQLGHEGVALRGGVQYLRRVVIHIRYEHTDGHVAVERRRTVVSGHHVDFKTPELFIIK